MVTDSFNKQSLIFDGGISGHVREELNPVHTGVLDHQGAAFMEGLLTQAELQEKTFRNEAIDGGALQIYQAQQKEIERINRALATRSAYSSYASVTIQLGDLLFSGDKACCWLDERINWLSDVQQDIDNQLSDPGNTEIDIDTQTAYDVHRRWQGEVTVHRRDDGSFYLDRDDAALVRDRFENEISTLEADKETIKDNGPEGTQNQDENVTVSQAAQDAMIEGALTDDDPNLKKEDMTEAQIDTATEICVAREDAGITLEGCSAFTGDPTAIGPTATAAPPAPGSGP